ncbi:MAG: OmpA family protein, partial [Desulfovibrionaceae bacterium]
HILFFLDHSGSMNLHHYLVDETKIALAKRLLADLVREMPDGFAGVSIHAFSPFETFLPDQALHRRQALAAIDAIPTDFPVRGRRTTLDRDMRRLLGLLAGMEGTVSVVMLTDGDANLGPDPLERFRLIHDIFKDRVVFHFVSYAGRRAGRQTIRQLRRIDGRGEYAFGDTLLQRGREYDQFVSSALLHFSEGPGSVAAVPASQTQSGMEPPVDPALAPAEDETLPGIEPAAELDLVVELESAMLAAGSRAGSGSEQMIVLRLRPADKAPRGDALGREIVPGLVYVLALLSKNPELEMSIEVHTDSLGGDTENMEVCRRWGRLVRDWLASRGVDPVRLSVEPYGELRPLFDNASPWGRRLNRRITFRALRPGGAS